MKQSVKLLLQGGVLTLLTVSFNANAQHLPNYGFNDWETAGTSITYGSGMYKVDEQRPGTEPSSWNGSAAKKIVTFEVITKATEGDNNYVSLTNKFNTLLVKTAIPGYLTLGTPWIYGANDITKCNGGTIGGINFKYKPSALKLKVKRTDTNDEQSYIIAYLWNGTFTSKVGAVGNPTDGTQNDVDRAVLGTAETAAAVSGDGKLVAQLQHIVDKTVSQWAELTIPFEYDELAGAPTKMNVVIAAGDYWTRENLAEGTTLLVDDVDFVYPTEEHQGKIVVVDLATDEAGTVDANASDWYDATLTVEDWGNIVEQTEEKKGNYSSEGRVTIHSALGDDVVLDNVKITHHDDYIWLEHSTANTTLEGSLHNDGTKRVYYDVNPAAAANVAQPTAVDLTKPYRVKFLDTESASTTGIEEIDGEAVKAVVFGGQGYVSINGVEGMATIYSLTGAKIAEAYVDGEAVIAVPAGVVIVAYPGGAVKTVIK